MDRHFSEIKVHVLKVIFDGECVYRYYREWSRYRMIMKGAPERVYPFCHGDNTEADEAP